MQATQAVRLPDLDPVLGPVAARHRDNTPRRTALALLCRAYGATPPIPASQVRLWVTNRLTTTRPDIVKLAAVPQSWRPLVADARRRAGLVKKSSGRQQLAIGVARQLVGHLLAPSRGAERGGAASGPRVVGARYAIAVIAARALGFLQPDATGPTAGIKTPKLAADQLAVVAGVGRQAASGWLRIATDLGLERVGTPKAATSEPAQPVKPSGKPPIWKLRQLRGSGVVAADDHPATIDALAALDQTDSLAAVILSAASPAWGWTDHLGPAGRLRLTDWLVLVADVAGAEPTDLGVPASSVVRARRTLARTGLTADLARSDPTAWVDRLDEIARTAGPDRSTAMDRARAAEADQRARAADRKAAVIAVRAAKDATQAERAAVRKRIAAETRRARRGATSRRPSPKPATASTVQTATVPLPGGFNPAMAAQMDRLAALVAAQRPGWVVDRIDADRGVAVIRHTAVA